MRSESCGAALVETIVVIPDTHYPAHDRKALNAVIGFIGDIQPDQVIHIGDLMDYPQPSRWTKDTRAEFEGSVYTDSEKCVNEFLKPLREAYSGPVGIHEGNHDERTRVYMEKYAPALAQTDMFDFDKLCRFDEFGIDKLPDFYDVAPGWITTHGHRGGIRLNQNGGMTAVNGGIKLNKSVVMGHTHRQGISHRTTGIGGQQDRITGVEVGNLMDQTKAGYLKGGTGNWQTGFGVLEVDGKHVNARTIPITHGRFIYNGKVYKT